MTSSELGPRPPPAKSGPGVSMVRDKVRVSVRDRIGVRISDGVRVSTFLARDVIYTSRAYATMSVSVSLSVCL